MNALITVGRAERGIFMPIWEKIKKYIRVQYVVTFLFFFAVYGIMFIRHYAKDTYYAIMNASRYGIGNVSLGRFGCEIAYRIGIALGMDYVKAFRFLIFGLIFSMAFFTCIVLKRLTDGRENTSRQEYLLFWLGAASLTCNPFIAEWLQFWECSFQWGGALIFCGLAIGTVKGKLGWKKYIITTFLVFCSLSFYQAAIALFLTAGLMIVYVSADGKINAGSFKSTLWIIASGGCASVLNLLGIKLFQKLGMAGATKRTGDITVETIINNVKGIMQTIPRLLLDSFKLYPKGLLLFVMALMLTISLLNIYRRKEHMLNKSVYILLLWFICLFATFLPHLMTTSLWIAQRTIVSFWGILGVMEIACAVNVKRGQALCAGTGGLACLVCIMFIQIYAVELIGTNMLDRECVNAIESKITEYEEETGNEITTIFIHGDEKVTTHYSFIEYSTRNMAERALTGSVYGANSLNFYTGKNYARRVMDEEAYRAYFGENNWDYLNLEAQTHFEEDTLYLVFY